MSQTNPADRTAGEICAAIEAGELSSRDALEAHLERVEARNGPINAVVALDAEGARYRRDRFHQPWSWSAASTFSAVIGRSRMRTPTASATAFPIAGAVGAFGVSPMALMP